MSVQQDLRVLVENVQKANSFKKPLPPNKPSSSKAKNPAQEPTASTSKAPDPKPSIPAPEPVPSTSNTSEPTMADRSPYAMEIFRVKTNVMEIAREKIQAERNPNPTELHQMALAYYRKLFRDYANQPKMRLFPPLSNLRFVSQYYEYRFYLALNNSMKSQEDYDDYDDVMKDAGLQHCWVDMRKNNVVLQDRDKIVALLQERFEHWPGELEKLSKYLMDAQGNRERKEQKELAKQKEQLPPPSESEVGSVFSDIPYVESEESPLSMPDKLIDLLTRLLAKSSSTTSGSEPRR